MKKILITSLFISIFILSACSVKEEPPVNDLTQAETERAISYQRAVFDVYFGNSEFDPGMSDCSKVFPVERIALKSGDLIETVLRELFKGPSESEEQNSYFSSFSSTTKDILKNSKIEDRTLYINFVDIRGLISQAGTSCGGAHFFSEINKTVKQFSTLDNIIFAIDGDPSTFYEWTQIGCPLPGSENNYCNASPFKDM